MLYEVITHEFRPIVRAKILRNTSHQHDVGQRLNHLLAAQPARHSDRQTFPRVFVDEGQQPKASTIVGEGAHKVVAPDVVCSLGPQPYTGTVVQSYNFV